jgi:hypothetical protein
MCVASFEFFNVFLNLLIYYIIVAAVLSFLKLTCNPLILSFDEIFQFLKN